MSPGTIVSLATVLSVVVLSLGALAGACEPAGVLEADSAAEFEELEAAHEAIDLSSVDYPLMAEAIFHETNERRTREHLPPLGHLVELGQAACVHAEAMVRQDFFAHRNPNDPGNETPLERVRGQGLDVGFVAENIGQAFALRYRQGEPVYTRNEGGRTLFSREPGGEPLGVRSYAELAGALLDSWMASEGHRRNILAAEPVDFGAGCELGRDDRLGMPMFWCVQLFFAPL
jgi:uncharacterized protein YkwD